jgi:ribosomal protein L7/L12
MNQWNWLKDVAIASIGVGIIGAAFRKRTGEAVTVDDLKARFEPGKPTVELVLVQCGPQKLAAMKLVRELTGLSLTGSKLFVENPPLAIRGLDSDAAQRAKRRFDAIGATTHVPD